MKKQLFTHGFNFAESILILALIDWAFWSGSISSIAAWLAVVILVDVCKFVPNSFIAKYKYNIFDVVTMSIVFMFFINGMVVWGLVAAVVLSLISVIGEREV